MSKSRTLREGAAPPPMKRASSSMSSPGRSATIWTNAAASAVVGREKEGRRERTRVRRPQRKTRRCRTFRQQANQPCSVLTVPSHRPAIVPNTEAPLHPFLSLSLSPPLPRTASGNGPAGDSGRIVGNVGQHSVVAGDGVECEEAHFVERLPSQPRQGVVPATQDDRRSRWVVANKGGLVTHAPTTEHDRIH